MGRGLGQGLTNLQISRVMSVAEKTVKNTVSKALGKLEVGSRIQAAVLVTAALAASADPAPADYRFCRSQTLIDDVIGALLDCTSEAGPVRVPDAERSRRASLLAAALAATRAVRPRMDRRSGEKPDDDCTDAWQAARRHRHPSRPPPSLPTAVAGHCRNRPATGMHDLPGCGNAADRMVLPTHSRHPRSGAWGSSGPGTAGTARNPHARACRSLIPRGGPAPSAGPPPYSAACLPLV